ncbi:hypothetical protein [Coraliomargarita parva]|uniref:hypothetical protein n=1 Tax=Coraliomargarita parva TaxID=3014050 RepID=UPI0022B362E4|nr:hypothetical protein [Coraliomargarita parva]
MKYLVALSLFCVVGLSAQTPSASEIINRARATIADESVLDGLVTLQMTGGIVPAEPKMPDATLLIIARKPGSQRLEVRVDDLVETTILSGEDACIIRSNLNAKASQMRTLTGKEMDQVQYSTRQYFSYFRPDFKNGERVSYEGIEQRRGIRCHKLVYSYPEEGPVTVRYFAVNDDSLVSTVSDAMVESVESGTQLIGGIKFPERVEYYQDGKKLHTVVLTNIFVNKPLPDGIFTIPQGQKQKPETTVF